jgi:hypothetical protein
VRGSDKPRIVQVGYNANYINSIEQKLGIQRAIDNLLDSEDIEAIFIFNKEMNIIAAPRSNGKLTGTRELAVEEIKPVKNVIESGESQLVSGKKTISFISPIQNDAGEAIGAALIRTSTAHINDLVNWLRHRRAHSNSGCGNGELTRTSASGANPSHYQSCA